MQRSGPAQIDPEVARFYVERTAYGGRERPQAQAVGGNAEKDVVHHRVADHCRVHNLAGVEAPLIGHMAHQGVDRGDKDRLHSLRAVGASRRVRDAGHDVGSKKHLGVGDGARRDKTAVLKVRRIRRHGGGANIEGEAEASCVPSGQRPDDLFFLPDEDGRPSFKVRACPAQVRKHRRVGREVVEPMAQGHQALDALETRPPGLPFCEVDGIAFDRGVDRARASGKELFPRVADEALLRQEDGNIALDAGHAGQSIARRLLCDFQQRGFALRGTFSFPFHDAHPALAAETLPAARGVNINACVPGGIEDRFSFSPFCLPRGGGEEDAPALRRHCLPSPSRARIEHRADRQPSSPICRNWRRV